MDGWMDAWSCFSVVSKKFPTCFLEHRELIIVMEHHWWKCVHFGYVSTLDMLKHLNRDQVRVGLQGYQYLRRNLHGNSWKRRSNRRSNAETMQKTHSSSIILNQRGREKSQPPSLGRHLHHWRCKMIRVWLWVCKSEQGRNIRP